MKKLTTIIFILAIIFLWLGSWYGFVDYHEKTHEEIYRIYGCEKITRDTKWNGATTHCNDLNISQSTYEKMRDMTAQTEIIGYHTWSIIRTMLLIATALLMYLFGKEMRE